MEDHMTNILLGLFFFTVALVGSESQSLGSSPMEPELGITEGSDLAALSRAPLPSDINIVMAQMALAAFGIGGGPFDGIWTPENQRAVKAYQKIRGIPLTEDLDLTTSMSLSKDLDEWRQQVPYPPFMTIDFTQWENGHISAIGTWTSENNEGWNLSNVTTLSCWRNEKICLEATAEYREDVKGLGVGQRFYMIDHWNESEIVTVKDRDNCPVSAVKIGRSTEAVTSTRFPDGQEGCPDQGAPITLRLIDGYMVRQQAELARLDRFRSLIQSPGFALPDGRARR
jgi:peptidoglycan hydrolase-like protein with peptidoglycan-binding domain